MLNNNRREKGEVVLYNWRIPKLSNGDRSYGRFRVYYPAPELEVAEVKE